MKTSMAFLVLLVSNYFFSQTIHSEKLDNYFNYIENNNLGVGRLSVFKNGKEVYAKSFGQKNISELIDDKNTRYQVGSVTKMMTAVLIFKLIEEKKLDLNDKLSAFYPEVPNSELITLKNLLEHTSGLGSYVVKDGEVWVTEKTTDREIMELIVKQGKSFEPGEKTAYSNSAYYLLTKILEKKHNKPFYQILYSEIIQPLRLKNLASFKPDQKNVFLPYRYENNSWTILKKEINLLNVIGVGDVSATPYDLNIFINSLFHNKILKKESMELMEPKPGKENWGRGMAIWDFNDLIFYGHGGDTLGSHAILIYNKEDDLSIAYVTNGERIKKENFMQNVVDLLYNKEIKLPEIQDKP
ncbi:class A beta-lactamase-related serine hydrolase [Chryseobacterium sp. G0162]|uniref:serine hydrolase domain-containing protein n=1 Tax=Chryseobacterium sp. G0162 TaxID=2487063 RepID=UPI000F4E16C2|nr:serine hydrolase domain-containing protein [Chryseobacterium sp. G0162]AZB10822.1 class A beta-lactamase-related serine hydrolase [Chryseobacterium sp. G0162]